MWFLWWDRPSPNPPLTYDNYLSAHFSTSSKIRTRDHISHRSGSAPSSDNPVTIVQEIHVLTSHHIHTWTWTRVLSSRSMLWLNFFDAIQFGSAVKVAALPAAHDIHRGVRKTKSGTVWVARSIVPRAVWNTAACAPDSLQACIIVSGPSGAVRHVMCA